MSIFVTIRPWSPGIMLLEVLSHNGRNTSKLRLASSSDMETCENLTFKFLDQTKHNEPTEYWYSLLTLGQRFQHSVKHTSTIHQSKKFRPLPFMLSSSPLNGSQLKWFFKILRHDSFSGVITKDSCGTCPWEVKHAIGEKFIDLLILA